MRCCFFLLHFCCVCCIVLQQNKRTLNTKKPLRGLVFYKQEEFWRWSSFGRQEFCIAGVLMFPCGNVHGKRKNSFYTIDQFCWAQASCRGNAKNSNKKLGKLPLSHSSSRREPLLSDPLPWRPHASYYMVHILLRSVVTVFPLYFFTYLTFLSDCCGHENYFVHINLLSRVWGEGPHFGEISANMGHLRDNRPSLPSCWTSGMHRASWRNNGTSYFKI